MSSPSHRARHAASWLLTALVLLPGPGRAQAPGTAGPLRVTVNHAEVVTLQASASTALVANPDIAEVVSERGNVLFVLGRKPGLTNLLVYDATGKRLLGREIMVVPEQAGMVSITRETDVTTYFCEPHCVFYEHEQGGSPPTPPAAAPTGGGQQQAPAQPAPGAAAPGAAPPPSAVARPY